MAALSVAAALWGAVPAASSPPFRVRITTDPVAATVAAPGGIRVTDRTGTAVWRPDLGTKITFVAESRRAGPPVYRAQVASLTSEAKARELLGDLSRELGVPGSVHYHPDRGAWRVRIGAGDTPEALDPLVQSLRDRGYEGVWVTEDSPPGQRGKIRLVDGGWNDHLARQAVLRVTPVRRGEALQVSERTYRGFIDVLLDRRGDLALVNELPLEQYLRGVVPNELGPNVFPELEALKAQAVAARTYAWRNRGQFGEDGYDLCDTPRCQVYFGAGTEHPMSDQALAETEGLVLTHHGEPINAMYTSTCGGHTEHGRLVFSEESGPYLTGVPCYPERRKSRERRLLLRGREPGPVLLDGQGGEIQRELWLLTSLEILESDGWSQEDLAAAPAAGEPGPWLDALLRQVGKSGVPATAYRGADRGDLVRVLVERLDWWERARLRVNDADLGYLLDFPDAARISGADRRAWALLLKDGIVEPFPGHRLGPGGVPGRAEWVRILSRVVDYYQADGLLRGDVRGTDSGGLRLQVEGEERVLELAGDLRLVKMLRGVGYPVVRMEALVGDKVAFHVRADAQGVEQITYLEVAVSPKSTSDDRYVKRYEWVELVSREEIARRLASRIRGIGELVDLEVLERGISGRVVRLQVVGSSGTQAIRGFDIRRALDLPEIRFAIDRQRDHKGRVRTFRFTGKGWGHGVGMCQVGAYGMALRGEDFRAILHHYYTGVKLKKVYP
jgi:stage II sporulation protein D